VNYLDIKEKIKSVIADQLEIEIDKLTMETTFEEIDADSLDIVELVMTLEEEFDLEISDEEIENIKSVGDVAKYIEESV